MINATHYAVDLETMGKGPKAAIVSIGCVRVEQGQIAGGLYHRIDLETAIAEGGEMDASTVQWWLRQSAEARIEVDGTDTTAVSLSFALHELAAFMAGGQSGPDEILVWGNGSSFDNVILRGAFERSWLTVPWKFWNDRDLRTLLAIFPEAKTAVTFEGTKHHALDDARHEARQLCHALALMKATQAGGAA
ncbi:3'-5' exonuclease [Metapseudomonas furukawaii]